MAVIPYPEWKLWMYYVNVFGMMQPNGTLPDSDCAIALAFGRNSIPDSMLNLAVCSRVYHRYITTDLPAIAHLNQEGFDPGKPNGEIAHVIEHYIETYRRPVAAQWELVVALYQIYGEQWVTSAIKESRLFCLWPHAGRISYPSVHVLEDAHRVILAQDKRINARLLLAHDLHMPRIYMLARKVWSDPNPIVGFKMITRSFDPKSVQKMTTTPAQWYWYEARTRIHHLLHHWV